MKEIKQLLTKIFPNEKILEIKEFEEGYNNVAYDIKLENKGIVFKKIKLLEDKKLALKQKALKELLQNKYPNFPIADIIYDNYSKKEVNYSFIILEKIEGKSLKKVYNKITNKEKLFEQYGEIYGMFHSFKYEKYSELNYKLEQRHSYESWQEKKENEINKMFERLKEDNIISEEQIETESQFYQKHKHLLSLESEPRLCHGDASNTNLIIKNNLIHGIIDFEFARVSGTIEDLFSGFDFGDEKFKYKTSIVKGYSKYNELPENWERLYYFYTWMKNLSRLSKLKSHKWRNLDEPQTIKRKDTMRNNCLNKLEEIHNILK